MRHIRSHFSKHYICSEVAEKNPFEAREEAGEPLQEDALSDSSVHEHTDQDEADSHEARVNAMVEKFKDEDVPQYSAEHLHEMIQTFVPTIIGQLSGSSQWHGVQISDDVAIDIIAKVSAEFPSGDENFYSKTQAREVFTIVTRLCGDAFSAANINSVNDNTGGVPPEPAP